MLFLLFLTSVTSATSVTSVKCKRECKSSGLFYASGTVDQCFSTSYPSDLQFVKYTCSPPTSKDGTRAIMTLNGFDVGEEGGGASSCDGIYHKNTEKIAALSTGWFNGGSNCGKMIKISKNGKTSFAKIVDECDSRQGCDPEHGYLPPCGNNIVDTSQAIWDELGLDSQVGEIEIMWSWN